MFLIILKKFLSYFNILYFLNIIIDLKTKLQQLFSALNTALFES
jgi:hypothetical protein